MSSLSCKAVVGNLQCGDKEAKPDMSKEEKHLCHRAAVTSLLFTQAQELISMPSYQQGRLAEALRDVYLHIDELLSSEALREELTALAGPKEPSGGQRCVHCTTLHCCAQQVTQPDQHAQVYCLPQRGV